MRTVVIRVLCGAFCVISGAFLGGCVIQLGGTQPSPTEPITVTAPAKAASAEPGPSTEVPSPAPIATEPTIVEPDEPFYFVTPSGNLYCAIFSDGSAGCQAFSLVDNLPECDDPGVTSSPSVYLRVGEDASMDCISEGAYVGETSTMLGYGLESTRFGITCRSASTGWRVPTT